MTSGPELTFTQEIADEICGKLADGLSLRAICRIPGMPPRSTIQKWVIADHNGFGGQYARARELGFDELAEEAIDIADTCRPGEIHKTSPDGVEVTTKDMIERSRLQVDTRKWYLSKLAHKKYGDKLVDEPNRGVQENAEGILDKLNKTTGAFDVQPQATPSPDVVE